MNKRCRTRIFLRVNCILANRDEIDNLKKNRFTYKPKRNVQSNADTNLLPTHTYTHHSENSKMLVWYQNFTLKKAMELRMLEEL